MFSRSRMVLHNLHFVRIWYVKISPFLIAVQNTKLLFDVTFYTEDCMLHFEISQSRFGHMGTIIATWSLLGLEPTYPT